MVAYPEIMRSRRETVGEPVHDPTVVVGMPQVSSETVRDTQEVTAGSGQGTTTGTMSGSAVIEAYLAAVRDLPQVQQVFVDDLGQPRHIWTIISAEPWTFGPRHEVFHAELIAMDAAGHPAIDWNLANVQELDWDLPASLATSMQAVYNRP